MNPVLVVVDHVLGNQPPQMRFVQRNDVVEKLAPTASHPTLGGPVLPRCLNTGALRLEACRLQERDYIGIELRIAVHDHITKSTSLGKRFPQLLYNPFGTWSAGDIEVQDSAPVVFNDEEAIQEFESHGGNGKEIYGGDCLSMIRQKGKPALAWIAAPLQSS